MQKSFEHVTLHSKNMTNDGEKDVATPKLFVYTPDESDIKNMKQTAKLSNVSVSGIFNQQEKRPYGGHSVGSTATGGNTTYHNKNVLMKAYY